MLVKGNSLGNAIATGLKSCGCFLQSMEKTDRISLSLLEVNPQH